LLHLVGVPYLHYLHWWCTVKHKSKWQYSRIKNQSWPVSTQMLKEQDYGIQQTRQSASVCRIEHTNSWMWRLHNANSRGACVTAGFRDEAAENCAIPGYYAASIGNFFYRRFGPSLRNYYLLRNDPEERSSVLVYIWNNGAFCKGRKKWTTESNSFHIRKRELSYVTLWKRHCRVLKDNKRGSVRVKPHYRFPLVIISYLW
jgi:hypothetical protein